MLEKRNLLNVMHSIYQDYTKLIIETSLPPGTCTQNNGKKEQIEKKELEGREKSTRGEDGTDIAMSHTNWSI